MRTEFIEEKEIKLIIHQIKRRARKVNLSKLSHFCQGNSGPQLDYETKCVSQNGCWPFCPTSLKLYVMADRFPSLVVRKREEMEASLI
jgi:hypothetical protein